MSQAMLEHVNVTVRDPNATAAWLSRVFGWDIRWQGPAISGGETIHIGTNNQYLAIYNPGKTPAHANDTYGRAGGLNHIALVVDDLDDIEKRVRSEGFKIGAHYDYEPGRRFYFDDDNGIEFEVVQYD